MTRHLHPLPEPLASKAEMAELLGISVDTIDAMRAAGMPCLKWGKRLVRFEPSKATAWLREHGRDEAA